METENMQEADWVAVKEWMTSWDSLRVVWQSTVVEVHSQPVCAGWAPWKQARSC